MKLRFYVRSLMHGFPEYSQDFSTYIMLGRSAHLYNAHCKTWFVVKPAPEDLSTLGRRACEIFEISRREFVLHTNKRAWLEIIEDKVGIRVTNIAKGLRGLFPVLKRIKWLKKWAFLDEWQDWDTWEQRAQRPMIGKDMSDG